jgi:hypothetical protein
MDRKRMWRLAYAAGCVLMGLVAAFALRDPLFALAGVIGAVVTLGSTDA